MVKKITVLVLSAALLGAAYVVATNDRVQETARSSWSKQARSSWSKQSDNARSSWSKNQKVARSSWSKHV